MTKVLVVRIICVLSLTSSLTAHQTMELSGVTAQAVWDDLRSRQTVTFSVVRDTAQFILVNLAWLTAGLLLWRGPALTMHQREEEEEEVKEVTFLQDRLSTSIQAIEFSRLNNFFMNPNKVARNMLVCSSLVGNSKSQYSSGNSN